MIESTTQGLQIIAASVPLQRSDKILIAATEFMGLAVPWIGTQNRVGFQIETVPCPHGRVRVEEFARVADNRTRMILLSSVQWNTGYRADLAAFSEFARQRNIVLVVDAIQHLGAVPLDVGQTPVDFLVTGGHKWLNAPAGRGFLYVHPRMQERCRPPAWGYLNIAEPTVGWANYFATPEIPAVRPYDFVGGARRFEVGGTANYPGNVVLAASLRLINSLGKEAIASHIMGLTEHLIDRLRSLGAVIVSPPEPEARSGIVTFSLGSGVARDRECLQQLLDQRILISQRYTAGIGGLRVSAHFFNNREDVERVIEGVHFGRQS